MIGQLSDRDIYDCIGLGSTGDIVSKTLDGFGGWTILWGSSRQRDSTGFKILNIKLQDSFKWKIKSFSVKLSINVEITPQPRRWKTPCWAGCVRRSTPPLLSPVAPPWSDISHLVESLRLIVTKKKTCKITLNYRLTFAPGCRQTACLERGWKWPRKTCKDA